MQLARVVVCVRFLVDVIGVMVVVLMGRHTVDDVGAVLVAIFVVIFCNWRCTLYIIQTPQYSEKKRSLLQPWNLSGTPSHLLLVRLVLQLCVRGGLITGQITWAFF